MQFQKSFEPNCAEGRHYLHISPSGHMWQSACSDKTTSGGEQWWAISNLIPQCSGDWPDISSISLLVVESWKRQHHGHTIHPKKSSIQWICSKFFVLWNGHNYFWPPWLWRLLEAKNIIESPQSLALYHNIRLIQQCQCCFKKEKNKQCMFTTKWY